ncbi:hypothetical protein RCC89_01100 [Cytophagaceae bacterium ABcell3]|nr:hypothetical protein RCC89_01100 [Cytophagaceae bacterium ABcell3]
MVRFGFLLIYTFFTCASLVYGQERKAHDQEINVIAFSENSKILVSGGEDKVARVWNTFTGHMINSFKHPFEVRSLFINKNGNYLLAGDGAGHFFLWDVGSGELLKKVRNYKVLGFTSGQDKVLLAEETVSSNGVKVNFGLMTLEDNNYGIINLFDRAEDVVLDTNLVNAQVSSECDFLLMSDSSNIIKVLGLKNHQSRTFHFNKKVANWALHPNDSLLIVAGTNEIFDLHTGNVVARLKRPIDDPYLHFSADGNFLIYSKQGSLYKYHLKTREVIEYDHVKDVGKYMASHDGKYFAVIENGSSIKLWSQEAGGLGEAKEFIASEIVSEEALKQYKRGAYYYYDQDYSKAVSYLSSCIGKTKRADKVFLLRGRAYLKMGDYNKAVNDFLLDKEINDTRASYDLVKAYGVLGFSAKALEQLEAFQQSPYKKLWQDIEHDPKLEELHSSQEWKLYRQEYAESEGDKLAKKAEGKMENGEHMAALEYFNKAIKAEPKNALWYEKRASLYNQLHEYEKSRADYFKMFTYNEDLKSEYYEYTAASWCNEGGLDSCAMYLMRCIKEDASKYSLMVELAEIRLAQYRRKQAFDIIDTYLDIIPDDPDAWFVRAKMHGDKEKIQADAEKAAAIYDEKGKPVPKAVQELLD